MIDAEKILKETYPDLKIGKNNKAVLVMLRKLLHEQDFNHFIEKNQHLKGFAFLDELLRYFQFSYQISPESYQNIPSEGALVIVANHPIGTLDGLALVKLIRSVRPDVRIVANRVLSHMTALESVFLPIDVLSTTKKAHKKAYKAMLEALNNQEAVIIFPAGEVSRITPKGVRDGQWKAGFLKLAKKVRCPILPINIKAKNSSLFYFVSMLYKPMGTLLLTQEMFNKKQQEIKFKVGLPIPYSAFAGDDYSKKELSQRFRKHTLSLGKKKQRKNLFETFITIAHPGDSKALKKALFKSRLLGQTRDNKKIFLYRYQENCPVMREVARLRELTFRTVEEGTGESLDMDKFDIYYCHLILWDEEDLEIIGAYRIGEGDKIVATHGTEGFYTHTLFNFSDEFCSILPQSIELGRSFVQPRYWGQRSLDYLWYGIGAYLREQPNVKYLFGPVSISDAYSQQAKEIIISFYNQQFGSENKLAKARKPFTVSKKNQQFAQTEFQHDYRTSFKVLNKELKKLGVKVPTLYKQYVELCDESGCHFIDFNIDPDFNNCIDSLIMVELDKITAKKRQRYIGEGLAA